MDWQDEMNRWQDAQRAAGLLPTTLRTRREHLERLARWARDRPPYSLTVDDLIGWTGSHEWARETRRSVRASLRSFYGWAHLVGRTDENPAALLPRVKPAQPRPHPTPEREYRRAVMRADRRDRALLRLAAECGLRRAEVAQVHRRDIIEDLGGWTLVVHGKGARERMVPMPTSLAREVLALCLMGGGFAFPGDDGGHLSPRWVGTIVARLLPEGYTMHSLRHRFATRAYAVSHDMFATQELLGHASPATTRVYVQLERPTLRAIVDGIAS